MGQYIDIDIYIYAYIGSNALDDEENRQQKKERRNIQGDILNLFLSAWYRFQDSSGRQRFRKVPSGVIEHGDTKFTIYRQMIMALNLHL